MAQMAWVAGLVVPAAIRAALIPAFGAVRHSSEGVAAAMRDAEAWIARLCRLACSQAHGCARSAGRRAPRLLHQRGARRRRGRPLPRPAAGLGLAMIATPSLAGVQAGLNPWRYAGHAAAGLVFAVLAGVLLVPTMALGAAWAALSVCTVLALLALALRPSPAGLGALSWSCSLALLYCGSGTTRGGLRLALLWC